MVDADPVLPPPRAPRPASPWPVVLAVLTGVWTVAVTVGTQSLTWLIGQIVESSGRPVPGWVWPASAGLVALLIGVPALLLAILPRSVPVRWTGRAWLAAAVSLGVLGSLRSVPVLAHEVYLTLLALGAAGLAVLVSRLNRGPDQAPAASATAIGLAAGLACAVPWAWLGALGSLPETVLGLAAALAVGWLASAVLTSQFWSAHAGVPGPAAGRARFVLVGGLAAGVALAPLAAATGAGGVFLGTLFTVPALGFPAAALQPLTYGRSRWPILALVAAASAGPLLFVDPEETSLLLNLGTRDAGYWALIATVAGAVIALVTGLATGLTVVHGGRPLRARTPRRGAAAATALAVAAGAVTAYATVGQPGLHGDRLFVVLNTQADLSGLALIPDRAERLRTTYQRLVEHAERTQAGLRRDLERWRIGFTPYYLVNGLEVDGGAGVRAWLARRSDVDRVLVSPRLRPLPAPVPVARGTTGAPRGPQWNVTQVKADQVWTALGVTGRDIVIGTSDSGVDGAHPALRNGFRGGDDSWYDPWNGTREPTDRGGHGTHTLGSAVGRAPDGAIPRRIPEDAPAATPGAVGVAPGARWIGCVNLDRNFGSPARYLDCLEFMLAPFPHGGNPLRDGRPERAPHILTNSWGCPDLEGCDESALRPATAALAAAGLFVVAAAGNTGPFCDSVDDPPAIYPDVVTVGAVNRGGTVTDFSSRGPAPDGTPKPDLTAPGDEILSTLPGGTYGILGGTSMAAPHVAGVVALMWSANPALIGDLARTRQLLVDTARPPLPSFGPTGEDACGGPANVRGSGVVDALAAVRAAQRAGQ